MKLFSLNCNKCGAPLDVPGKVRFLTCQYCSAKLSVQRTSPPEVACDTPTSDTRNRML